MAETISQHQQSAFTVPVNSSTADASEVLGNDNTLRSTYNAHDSDSGVHVQSSVLASRPAAGAAGRKWLTTDGLRAYYDTGSAWSEIAYIPNAIGTAQGDILYTTAASTWAALAKGTARQVLQMNAGATLPEWTSDLSIASVTLSGIQSITLTHATAKVVPGATSFTFRNNADNADNLLISDAGAITLRGLLTVNAGLTVASGTTSVGILNVNSALTLGSGQTLTLTGTTIVGAPTWSSSQAITLSTAAQPNVTSLGTLTGLNLGNAQAIDWNSGAVTLTASGAVLTLSGSATALLSLYPSSGTQASLRIPHGAAPSAPVNGDVWTTTAGLFVQINGGTVGPLT